jgi:ABC-type bacteriocin/lantibiotic exporter with double-glycine peptidase domain
MRKVLPILGFPTLLILCTSIGVSHAHAFDEATKLDCGVNALFLLLRLEGRDISYRQVDAALPPANPLGYSMAELRDTAKKLGCEIEGVQQSRKSAPLHRPAIAFFKDAGSGHFAVLRPVGTTGTMVQILDPPRAPQIVDFDRLIHERSWTGRLLLRTEEPFQRLIWALVGFVIVFSALRWFAPRWLRNLSATKAIGGNAVS